MKQIINTLVIRDGLTVEQATELCKDVKSEIRSMAEKNVPYEEIEDFFYSEIGLELDFILPFLF